MNVNPPARRRYLLVCPGNLAAGEERLARELAAGGELWIVVRSNDDLAATPPRGTRVISLRALGKLRWEWQPDFVIYASAPPARWHWKIWWWKRRRAPAALLGGHWLPVPRKTFGHWVAGWAWESLDFWLAENEAAAEELQRAGAVRGRIGLTGSGAPPGENVAGFLQNRRDAEERSVLWVDDELSLNSPSTKHLLYSIPHLRTEGWEVRGWCLVADEAARAGIELRVFPPAPASLRLFTPYWFFALVNLHGLVQTVLKGRPPARVVHTVGSAFLGADIAAIHFVHHLWLRQQITLGLRNRKAVLELLWTVAAMLRDQLQYRNPRCRLLLPVSDCIADAVRAVCRSGMQVEVLPNSYDETRFNPAVRAEWRESMRRQLGFAAEDKLFCFASQGHYRRKGFWLAVEGLARVRAEAPLAGRMVRLLVVGGSPKTLDGLRRDLARTQPNWEAWIALAGTQPQVESYLSAGDAFLFPSHFEAFCLAEIESGALGLPLLLTPHPGTEMILRDGVNGLLLSFDPAEMAKTLNHFLQEGLPPFTASPGQALTRAGYARNLVEIYARIL